VLFVLLALVMGWLGGQFLPVSASNIVQPSGGGSPFDYFQADLAPITLTGADQVYYTINAPALAAGRCYAIASEHSQVGAQPNIKVKVGATVVFTPMVDSDSIGSPTGSNYAGFLWHIGYCNTTAQTGQTVTYFFPEWYATVNLVTWTVYKTLPNATPTPINWAVPNVITLTVTQGSSQPGGTFTPQHVHLKTE